MLQRQSSAVLPTIQLPQDPDDAEPHHHASHRHEAQASSAASALGRFRKVGWCKKTGVTFKNPNRPGVPLSDVEVRELVGADRSTAFTVMPPPLSLSQLQVTTNVKTRFLLLLEHRLQYGSTSTFEAFQKGGAAACAKDILGELFLTGDAWARPVDATSIVVCGDPAMMKKSGKLYLLTFTSADVRVEWELAFHFFLFRAVPTERMERLLLSGWISAFPNLGTKMHRVVGRRMSIVSKKVPDSPAQASPSRPTESRTLPPRRKGSHPSLNPPDAPAKHTPDAPAAEEDDEADAIGNVVSEDDSSSSSNDSGGSDTSEGSPTRSSKKNLLLTKKNSEMSAAFQSFMFSKRHRHVVDAAGDIAGNPPMPSPAPFVLSGTTAPGAAVDVLVAHAHDELNNNGMHFLLRCQRSTTTATAAAAGGGSSHNRQPTTIIKPEPTYLRIVWQRSSHTIHSVPVLRETTDITRAARFALRSFAESAGQYSPPRVVPVDAPSWQLYTRDSGAALTATSSAAAAATTTTEREIILRPVFPMTTLPTPTVANSDGGTTAAGVSSGGASGASALSPNNSLQQPWAFRACLWEGSSRAESSSSPGAGMLETASFSFLLEGSATAKGGSRPLAAPGGSDYRVALSSVGKLFIISAEHTESATVSLSGFVPLEAVPAVSDADMQFQLTHQTPAMRERALFRAATRALSTNFLQQGLLEPFRVVFVGASGSGKSTVAHWVDKYSLHHNHQQHQQQRGGNHRTPASAGNRPPAAASGQPPLSSPGGGGADDSSIAEDISKRIHTVNCSGIAVPLVITDVPSSSSAAYIRTQCIGADVVVCLFDVSDEHSLQWLEGHMPVICADAKDDLSGVGGSKSNRMMGSDGAQGAGAGGTHSSNATGLPRTLPRTKFILCATRVDSLRVAVDSYRLEAFRTATEAFTGPSSVAWLPPIETVFASANGASGGGGVSGADNSATTPSRQQQASRGGGGPLLSSAHSFASSNDPRDDEAPLPFSQFGARWRMWRLPTATREASAPVARELQALLVEGNLSESFLFSPNLKRLAAEGTTLSHQQLLQKLGSGSSGGVQTPLIPGTPAAMLDVGQQGNVSFSAKDPLASTQKNATTGGSDAFRDRSPSDNGADDSCELYDDADWKVPRQLMQHLGGVLEELYLVRIGKSLGWTEAMVSRFAVASCVACMDARQEDAVEKEERRVREERMLGSGTHVKPPDGLHMSGGGTALSSRIVVNMFRMLHLPKPYQYDVVREVLHTPKVTRQKGGTGSSGAHVGDDGSNALTSPTTTKTPPRQGTRGWRGDGDVWGGGGTPQVPRGMDASSLLLNSSISVIGGDRRNSAGIPLLSPMTLTSSKHFNSTLHMGTLRSPGLLDQSSRFLQSTHGGGGGGTVASLSEMISKYPLNDSMMMTTPGLPPALLPSIMAGAAGGGGGRGVRGSSSLPTWKEVIACSLRQWHEHWLVFRWVAASAAAGDVRAELIMGMLRGEHDEFTFLPSAQQKRTILRGTKQQSNLASGITSTMTVPMTKLPNIGVSEDNDAASVGLVRNTLLRESSLWGRSSRGKHGGEDGTSLSASQSSGNAPASGRENRSSSSGSESRHRREEDEEDDDDDTSSVLSNQALSMSCNHRRRLWIPIAPEGSAPSATSSHMVAVGSGGHDNMHKRLFHPTDLMYFAFGCYAPHDMPPLTIPDAALWVYQQPQRQWGSTLASTGGGVGGAKPSGAGANAATSTSSRFGHVSPSMIETMFWMVGIEVRRDHTSRLLRWADTNGDRLTDASDFFRWFTWLLFGLSAHDRSGDGSQQTSMMRPTAAGGEDPLGGGGAAAAENDAPSSAALNANNISSPSAQASSSVGSSYLALLSTLWALRTYHWIPMLESLSTSCKSGLSRDRAWAAAACAHALHLRPEAFGDVLAVFEGRARGGGTGGRGSGSGGGAGGLDDEWDDSSARGNSASGGAVVPAPRGVASSVLTRMAAALFGKSSIAADNDNDNGGGNGGQPLQRSSCCHRCRMTFRAIFRPATECQECHNLFCSRCCKSIIVLNDANKTEKRKLCLTCRRTQSTFFDDYNDGGAGVDTIDGSPNKMQRLSAEGGHHHRLSSNTLESLDATTTSATDDGAGGGTRGLTAAAGSHQGIHHHHSGSQLPVSSTATAATSATTGASAGHVIWEDDAQTSCSICAATFTVLRRRHHCRVCGALVCGSCSPHTVQLKDFVGLQRMCVSCFQGRRALEANQERRRNFMHQHTSPPHKLGGSSTVAAATTVSTNSGAALSPTSNEAQSSPREHASSATGGSSIPSPTNGVVRRASLLQRQASSASIDGREHTYGVREAGATEEDRQLRKQRWRGLERAVLASVQLQHAGGGSPTMRSTDQAADDADDDDEWAWLLAAQAMNGGGSGSGATDQQATGATEGDHRLLSNNNSGSAPGQQRKGALLRPWYETYSLEDERALIEAARVALHEQARTVEYLISMPGGKAAIDAERGATWSYAVYQPGWFAAHDSALEATYTAKQLEEMGPDVGPH